MKNSNRDLIGSLAVFSLKKSYADVKYFYLHVYTRMYICVYLHTRMHVHVRAYVYFYTYVTYTI